MGPTDRSGAPGRYLTPLFIAGIYAACGVAWILLSDRALALLPIEQLARWQTLKGLSYVAVTSALLYGLTRAGMAAIRQGERPYRQMFETTNVGMLLDPETGRIVDANAAASAFYGWTHDELVGRPVHEINTLGEAGVRAELQRAASGERRHFLFQHRTASGEIRDVEVFSSVVDVGGRRLIYSLVHDLTARIRAEHALEASEARYRAVMAEASDAILIMDQELRLVDVNAKAFELTGYDRRELLVMKFTDLIPPEELERIPIRLAELKSGRTIVQQRRFVRKDGTLASVEISARILDDGRIQAIARDVTERHLLEEQLRQAQKMEAIGQLTGGIAHDLNNVLSIILTNAELVAQGLPEDRADLREELADLEQSAKRGATMIRKLLSFSRNAPLEVVVLDLAAAVAEAGDTTRRLLPANIRMEVLVPSEPLLVQADGGAVEQILLNLATNARDAMPAGGHLRVEVARQPAASGEQGASDEYATLVVSDDGTGMDEATRSRIFEPFFTTKPAPLGTGLGMSMVYGLVRQQDAWINVESAPEKGTVVRIGFRRGVATSTEADRGRRPEAVQGLPAGTETVLVVEDELSLRRAMTRVLQRLGYTVLTAADGEEALELFRARGSEVDLVLSDIVMPRLGGRGLYEALRREGRMVRFLFSSGYGAEEIRQLAVDGVPPALIRKPWTVVDLAERVRSVLDA